MNFPVTLFRSDFKIELFITMSQNSNSQLPYSQIEEIRVSQIVDDGNMQHVYSQIDEGNHEKIIEMNEEKIEENNFQSVNDIQSILNEMDKMEEEPRVIQDIDFLSKFLKMYIEIPDDDYQKLLSVLLMRIFFEKIHQVYDLKMGYQLEINPIDLTREQAKELLALIEHIRPMIGDELLDQYINLPEIIKQPTVKDDIKDNLISSFVPGIDLTSKKKKEDAQNMILEIIEMLKETMKERIYYFANRFFTALLFKYVIGVDVMPGFTLDGILEEKFKPWNTNYKNVVLFYGYQPSNPNILVNRDYNRFGAIFVILNTLNNRKILENFCLKTVVELVKGYKSGNTISKNLQVNENAVLVSQIISNISNIREHEIEILKNKNDNQRKQWNDAINDLTTIHGDATKPVKNTKRLRIYTSVTLEYLLDYMKEKGYTLALVPNQKVVTLTVPKKGEQAKFKIGLKGVEKN